MPACDGQTDGRTDGIAVANTALAMRALRGAVKSHARQTYIRHIWSAEEHAAGETAVTDCTIMIVISRAAALQWSITATRYSYSTRQDKIVNKEDGASIHQTLHSTD